MALMEVVSVQAEIDGLPDRPFCTLAEGQRFVERQTGESKPTFYRRYREGFFEEVIRNIAGRDLMHTQGLRAMYAVEK